MRETVFADSNNDNKNQTYIHEKSFGRKGVALSVCVNHLFLLLVGICPRHTGYSESVFPRNAASDQDAGVGRAVCDVSGLLPDGRAGGAVYPSFRYAPRRGGRSGALWTRRHGLLPERLREWGVGVWPVSADAVCHRVRTGTLEVAANPYVTLLGDRATAASRLNRAQSFNGAGCICGSLLGGLYCFSGDRPDISLPYIVIGVVVLLIAVVFSKIKLPEVVMEEVQAPVAAGGVEMRLRRHPMFVFGLLALFCYEVSEISINSFFVNYAAETDLVGWAVRALPGANHKLVASLVLSVGLLLFMGGRFLGSWVMQYIRAEKVLLFCISSAVVLTLFVVLDYPVVSFVASLLIFVVESIMFPTIFALSIKGLGPLTQRASAILMMSPIGGAVGTVVMGMAADLSNMTLAFVVPLMAYVVVWAYSFTVWRQVKARRRQAQSN